MTYAIFSRNITGLIFRPATKMSPVMATLPVAAIFASNVEGISGVGGGDLKQLFSYAYT